MMASDSASELDEIRAWLKAQPRYDYDRFARGELGAMESRGLKLETAELLFDYLHDAFEFASENRKDDRVLSYYPVSTALDLLGLFCSSMAAEWQERFWTVWKRRSKDPDLLRDMLIVGYTHASIYDYGWADSTETLINRSRRIAEVWEKEAEAEHAALELQRLTKSLRTQCEDHRARLEQDRQTMQANVRQERDALRQVESVTEAQEVEHLRKQIDSLEQEIEHERAKAVNARRETDELETLMKLLQ